MKQICMYFQVHQPMRLGRIKAFQPRPGHDYWDHETNRAIFERAARKCYLPANQLMLEMIRRGEGRFRIAYSLSGVFLEQAERWMPEVIDSFRALADTGCVEFLGETYYHSLAGLWDDEAEFTSQVQEHGRAMARLLGVRPKVFRNTELIYDDRIARRVQTLGFDGILAEGAPRLLGHRSPNHVYKGPSGLPVLLKHYPLSDDVAFRFSARDWQAYPLVSETYAGWLADTPGETINLFMDYETFGEHQWKETGIFDFMWHLPEAVDQKHNLVFATPSEVLQRCRPMGTVHAAQPVSWADEERDVSAWLGNRMQHALFARLQALRPQVLGTGDPETVHAWRLLQTSDHLYYASTKNMNDGQIHAYFSPYDSPYLAYINHMNAIHELGDKLRRGGRPMVEVEPDVRANDTILTH